MFKIYVPIYSVHFHLNLLYLGGQLSQLDFVRYIMRCLLKANVAFVQTRLNPHHQSEENRFGVG